MKTYKCVNTSWHTHMCCSTCWNRHPEAKREDMFLHSERQKEIAKEEFIKEAQDNGFSEYQAKFLYRKLS